MHLVNLQGEGLVVYPTHRVVMGRREVTGEVLHAFDVTEIDCPAGSGRGGARPGAVRHGRVRGMARRPAALRSCASCATGPPSAWRCRAPAAPVKKIDAAVLEAVVLAPLLGLLDPAQFATTESIRYVRELGAATGPVDQGDASAAFLLRAPTVDQVRAVAAAGAVMPQKSTYFFPKLHCGFLINPLDA